MIVAVENLSHRYGDRVALSGVSFSVRKGEIFGLLGPNGGGKSTLFKILSTLMQPTSGKASICGHDVDRESAAVRRRIGVVFQSQSLDKKLTVDENLTGQARLHGMSGPKMRERIDIVLARLSLTDRRGDIVETLSGGLKRRVEIAKGLLHQPELLLMDEASTGLDPGARRELWRYILELRNTENVTVLLTSHILDEADKCDRLALIHEGRLVSEGSPAELKKRIGGDVVVLETANPAELAPQIESRFQVRPISVDGTLRVEIANGHRFITEVVEAFPGAIESVALHKPTLEDVFLRETGAALW